jgi:hypothetical protein
LKIFVPILLALVVTSGTGYAYAQSIPLPPPSPESNPGETRIAENDRTPPKIEILTTELVAGKNVFRVRITDDSSLQVREVKYVSNGQLKIDGLFRDQNDIYRALVDLQPPSRIVMVSAGDANGNTASTFKEYEVKKSDDVFTQIMNMLSQIQRYFQNLAGQQTPS